MFWEWGWNFPHEIKFGITGIFIFFFFLSLVLLCRSSSLSVFKDNVIYFARAKGGQNDTVQEMREAVNEEEIGWVKEIAICVNLIWLLLTRFVHRHRCPAYNHNNNNNISQMKIGTRSVGSLFKVYILTIFNIYTSVYSSYSYSYLCHIIRFHFFFFNGSQIDHANHCWLFYVVVFCVVMVVFFSSSFFTFLFHPLFFLILLKN